MLCNNAEIAIFIYDMTSLATENLYSIYQTSTHVSVTWGSSWNIASDLVGLRWCLLICISNKLWVMLKMQDHILCGKVLEYIWSITTVKHKTQIPSSSCKGLKSCFFLCVYVSHLETLSGLPVLLNLLSQI